LKGPTSARICLSGGKSWLRHGRSTATAKSPRRARSFGSPGGQADGARGPAQNHPVAQVGTWRTSHQISTLRGRCSSVIRAPIGPCCTGERPPRRRPPGARQSRMKPLPAVRFAKYPSYPSRRQRSDRSAMGSRSPSPFGRQAPATPPGPRPCAGQPNRWLRPRGGSSAPSVVRGLSGGRCSKCDRRRSACGLRRVRRPRVRARL
jgi:hypothetical protein